MGVAAIVLVPTCRKSSGVELLVKVVFIIIINNKVVRNSSERPRQQCGCLVCRYYSTHSSIEN